MGYLKLGAAVLLFALCGLGIMYAVQRPKPDVAITNTPPSIPKQEPRSIGKSIEGRAIEAYTFGTGVNRVVFVGGIHGGYEWNSVVLAYKAIDYFKEHREEIPAGTTVIIIPNANPDGVYRVVQKEGRFDANEVPPNTGALGRFNARDVDLNRNFDCKWQPEAKWRGKKVSAGQSAFSEPESRALRDFVLQEKPSAVVFWHSQANAVYASECTEGVLQETRTVLQAYAKAANYPAIETFDAYEVTGDAEGWLASISIPAITVELASHESIEWEKNLAGMKAVISLYGTP